MKKACSRINKKKLLAAIGGDETLADFIITAARAFKQSLRSVMDMQRKQQNVRTSKAMQAHQANGRRMSVHCPYGWVRDPEDPKMMIEHEGEQAVIRRIVELRVEGLSYRTLCKRLEFEGMLNRGGSRFQAGRACALFKKATQRSRER